MRLLMDMLVRDYGRGPALAEKRPVCSTVRSSKLGRL